jgi:hypothetical protein
MAGCHGFSSDFPAATHFPASTVKHEENMRVKSKLVKSIKAVRFSSSQEKQVIRDGNKRKFAKAPPYLI